MKTKSDKLSEQIKKNKSLKRQITYLQKSLQSFIRGTNELVNENGILKTQCNNYKITLEETKNNYFDSINEKQIYRQELECFKNRSIELDKSLQNQINSNLEKGNIIETQQSIISNLIATLASLDYIKYKQEN